MLVEHECVFCPSSSFIFWRDAFPLEYAISERLMRLPFYSDESENRHDKPRQPSIFCEGCTGRRWLRRLFKPE